MGETTLDLIEVSVCIVFYEETEQLSNCLKSLRTQKQAPHFELILINNATTNDQAQNTLKEFKHPKCIQKRLLHNSTNNIGQARALGVENSQGKYILFTDPDCILPPNWIKLHKKQFLEAKKSNPKISSSGSSFYISPGNSFFLKLVSSLYRNPVAQLNSPQGLTPLVTTYVDHVPTLNAFYEKQSLLEVGNFDLHFQSVCEDVDIGYKLNNSGYLNLIHLEPSIEHSIENKLINWIKRCFKYGYGQALVIARHKSMKIRHIFIASYSLLLLFSSVLYQNTFIQGLWLLYFTLIFSKLFHDLMKKRIDLHMFFGLIPLIIITHLTYSLGFSYGSCKSLIASLWRPQYEPS